MEFILVPVLVVLAMQIDDNPSAQSQPKAGFSVQIVGLVKAQSSAILLTLDADESFRAITSGIISDKDLKSILSQRFAAHPKQAVQIILHMPNEKAITYEALGSALNRIRAAGSQGQNIVVFVHSSRLTK